MDDEDSWPDFTLAEVINKNKNHFVSISFSMGS